MGNNEAWCKASLARNDPSWHLRSKPTATAYLLPVSTLLAKSCQELDSAVPMQLPHLYSRGCLLAALRDGCLVLPSAGTLSNLLRTLLSVMPHLRKFSASPAVVQWRAGICESWRLNFLQAIQLWL